LKNANADAGHRPEPRGKAGTGRKSGEDKMSDPGRRRQILLKVFLAIVVLAVCLMIDLLTKHWAEQNLVAGETRKILPFFYLQRTANSGVAFGMLGGNTALIVAGNVVAMLVVCVYMAWERHPILAGIAGGAVLGGSVGNLVQRLGADGHVTDWMKFPHWPNFNMADVFIDAGIAAVVLGLIVQAVIVWRSGRREPSS
jgi:signal peptidase II